MTTEDQMTIDERYKYLRIQQPRYAQAQTRQEKKALLDEMERVTGLHRKYLIQLMRPNNLQRHPRSRERDKEYGPDVDAALALVWEAQDYICPERLQPVLVFTAEQLAHCGELYLAPSLKAQLGTISVSTVRRHLPPTPVYRVTRARKRLQNVHQEAIPIRRIPWDIKEPGHFELDLVHHCGARAEGEYCYTLQIVDVTTGWSGRRAILGRSYIVVADALYYLAHQIPFPLLELHPDNGSEFLNAHLLRFLKEHYPELERSRSHPGTPNDNRYVEQKNSTLVRAFLGDVRLDTVRQTRYLNHIYDQMHVYHNFIQPVMHQVAKVWVPNAEDAGGYTRRKHDAAAPPVVRLCATEILPQEKHAALLAQRQKINPLALRRKIHADLQHLFAYPGAVKGHPESAYQTLAQPELFPAAMAALGATETVDNSKDELPTVPTAPTTTFPLPPAN
jgi:transposase InsO family protein